MISTTHPRRQAPIGRPRDLAGRLERLLSHRALTLDKLAERGLEGRALADAVRALSQRRRLYVGEYQLGGHGA